MATAPPEVTATPVGPMTPVPYRVVWRRQDLHDTVTLALEPVADGLPGPAPGQFAMLWAFGVGEAPISFAGTDDGLWVHTIRGVGAVTEALCAAQPGDEIGVRGPFGTGWPVDRARGHDALIIAGGLGLAPVRPIVTHVLARRADFGRVGLLVGARSPDDLLYRDELDDWARPGHLDVIATVDTASPAWRGDVGVVTRIVDRVPFDADTVQAFVCGPEVMMRFAAQTLLDRGVDAERIWVSLERNMHCAIGHCGHCQLGPDFVCTAGPVLAWSHVGPVLRIRGR